MALELTEHLVVSMAPGDKAVLEGRGLIRKGAFRALGRTEDGTLVFADCQGSGASPYRVSLDLATGADRPTVRCSCPSRQFPCKHGIGLMLAFVAKGGEFKIAAAPKDLLEKRSKLVEKHTKVSSAASADPVAAAAANSKAAERALATKRAAAGKKAEEQKTALDTLEKFLLDLVSAGLGGLNAKSVKAIHDQAGRMQDADMQGARGLLLRLAALATAATGRARRAAGKAAVEEDHEDDGDALPPMTDAERQARTVALVTQLWATLRRGRKALEGKLEEGESRNEADAQAELLLGRKWRLDELKEAGYWTADRMLFELAHERYDDPVIEMLLTTGYLLDLGDGAIHVERTMIPHQAVRVTGVKHRQSRAGMVYVKEAALYPGASLNRRIRWDEKAADAVTERDRTPQDYAKLHAHARTVDAAIKSFREQLKNPLAGSEAVVLVAATRFGLAPDGTPVLVDAAGGRLAFRDPREVQYQTTKNLEYAAGAYGPGSVAVKLWYDLVERAVYAQALALFVGDKHLRLGM